MKTLSIVTIVLLALFACTKSTHNTTETNTSPAALSDSAAIADAVHGFYRWYTTFSQDTTHRVDFTDNRGEHLKLIQPKLERYYAHFKTSGFVSDAFIVNEYAFYRQCSEAWQHEAIDEVQSCLDADKYFCAQEWEPDFWTTSPVRIKSTGSMKVRATLYGTYFDNPMERNIDLVKENGKWLISHIECDMGVSTAETNAIQLKTSTIDEAYFTHKMARSKALVGSAFSRLELGNLVETDKLNAPGSKVGVLDTLLLSDRGRILIVGYDSGNETEGWLVQYDNRQKIVFWDQVYYADQVEYIKTINTQVLGKELVISTITDTDDNKSTKTNRYILTNQLVFERHNQ